MYIVVTDDGFGKLKTLYQSESYRDAIKWVKDSIKYWNSIGVKAEYKIFKYKTSIG